MFTILWDVKEPTHYSKRVGHEVFGVVAVLCESIAGPDQVKAAKDSTCSIKKKERKKHKKKKKERGSVVNYLLHC